ncbi:MAG: glycosyltransferase family 4 protein [Clostridia bacterium]|nr:glycosyltransferase family 4 protein [Clostridia bacterium]
MRVLVVSNHDGGLYKFRAEIMRKLCEENEVHLCLPFGEYIAKFEEMGCIYHACEFDRHGTNPLAELKQISFYKKLLKSVRPDIVLTYTIKPNIYAGIACASLGIPYLSTITGLGGALEHGGLSAKLLLQLYKFGLRKAKCVFFQNSSNQAFLTSRGIVRGKNRLLCGSGVNLEEHRLEAYPEKEEPFVFLTVGRIMRDKGIGEVLAAAKILHAENPNLIFRLVGAFDGDLDDEVLKAHEAGYVEYIGPQDDVHACMKQAHAVLHASYHEGIANVLLEGAACGRPLVATDVPGCRETYEDGVTGIACRAKDADDLVRGIRALLELPREKRVQMGLLGRAKVEREFDRKRVLEAVLEEIELALKG